MQPQRNDLDLIWHTVNTYCASIETTVKNFSRLVKQQYAQNASEHLDNRIQPSPDLSRSSILNTSSGTSNTTQLSTLLFNSETKQVFLRTALTRNLFKRLKKLAKRWIANVPDEQRKQATKVAQAIAKAVTDFRVSCITEKDLATYRAHIHQSFGREYHIPTEQIRLAFSQKIRVFLQNTKNEHALWVEKYAGCIDVNSDIIYFDTKLTKREHISDNSNDLIKNEPRMDDSSSFQSYHTLNDSNESNDELTPISLPFKRSLTSIHSHNDSNTPLVKRQKTNDYEPQFTESMFSNIGGVEEEKQEEKQE